MPDPATFQNAFGAALAERSEVWLSDPAMARALAVHRNTSARAARDALRDNYPVIYTLVGEDAFAACATAFVSVHPPADPRLCFYGAEFAAFLADYAPFHELAYIQDVARLERLIVEALFAVDAEPFDPLSCDPAAPLPLHPATRLARFASPAVAIWEAHQPHADADAMDALAWAPCVALVTRRQAVMVAALDAPTTRFVELCRDGAPLATAAEAAAEAGGDVATIFSALILSGAFQQPTC